METRKRSYDYGPGKESYAAIAKAYDESFGDPFVGMSDWWRSPQQWAEFERMKGTMARGLPALVRLYGKKTSEWPADPSPIPLFGPFTGAQHEFGGNDWLAAACQLAGLDVVDLSAFLLWGEQSKNPALFEA